MKLLACIRMRICNHHWRATLFQALFPGKGYQCTKCGKHEQFYSSPPKPKPRRVTIYQKIVVVLAFAVVMGAVLFSCARHQPMGEDIWIGLSTMEKRRQ